MKNIAIFASGSGTNAEKIMEHFKTSDKGAVVAVFSNKGDAQVLERARNYGIPAHVFTREEFYASDTVLDKLKGMCVDFIVLAGFLWLVPDNLVREYSGRIVNIHPALLPRYGGKGMYGDRVHRQVLLNREKESGISIHFVNDRFDEGEIIFQATCAIAEDDTPESLARKVHELEHLHFPRIIESLL